ncbi:MULTISPECIES: MarR family winged helix-turn-helix transcriptional regulator [unclassified Sphingomonas]|jgi:DNA-binding MarR family transcriptional regulator|uniref:MarR family winged helix-turn-helix transcriptional regulator n=1 Tax=unclassified Sphingomonas TaxID=196159 RepID=UPI00215197F0|nr:MULTISPECIES: MarR family winged helix-turn-helix transcriptional regulator [unclassified Sphingomonas]MCR5870999.1 MarR family winged helix-turn-helix transcriptional regulator [Sphingomonas sp. J344]UUY00679.1 MarR family winged helix-turn-helix transcriptional regulator [Sphingomonas sp. J315]
MAAAGGIGQRDRMSEDLPKTVAHLQARLPSGPIGRLLASIGNLSTSLGAIHARFAQDHGLGPRGIWIMSWISEGQGNPGAIARAMILPPSVISGDLNRLVEQGLVVRQRGAADGRRLDYSLTETGQALLAKAHARYVAILQGKFAEYPPDQIDALLRILFEISGHVRSHLDAADD